MLDLNSSSLRRSSVLIDQGLIKKVVLKCAGIGPSLRKHPSLDTEIEARAAYQNFVTKIF